MASTEFESNIEACEAKEAERAAACRSVQRSPMRPDTALALRREVHSASAGADDQTGPKHHDAGLAASRAHSGNELLAAVGAHDAALYPPMEHRLAAIEQACSTDAAQEQAESLGPNGSSPAEDGPAATLTLEMLTTRQELVLKPFWSTPTPSFQPPLAKKGTDLLVYLVVTAVSAAYDAYAEKTRPRATRNQAYAFLCADALDSWSAIEGVLPAEVEKTGKRLATQSEKVKKVAVRYQKALAAGDAATTALLLAQLSAPYACFKVTTPAAAPAPAAPIADSKREEGAEGAIAPAVVSSLSTVAAATTATPPLSTATPPLSAAAQPITRHILERRPPSKPCPSASPLCPSDDGWQRGYDAGKRSLEYEVERLQRELRMEKSCQAKVIEEMQADQEETVGILQRALGEAYYRLERAGAQIAGDLSDLRGLAFRDPPSLLLEAGYKRQQAPPLTPPEGRAMKRAFSRLADLGNKIEELAHFNKKHMGQLSHQSEDDSD